MSGNVIEIGDWSFKVKSANRPKREDDCDHHFVELDHRGDVVKCQKCGVQVSAFWALDMLTNAYAKAVDRLAREKQELQKAKDEALTLLAARKVQDAWRSRSMVPTCPHCSHGILPSDGFGGAMMSKSFELARREGLAAAKTAKASEAQPQVPASITRISSADAASPASRAASESAADPGDSTSAQPESEYDAFGW